MRSYRFAVLTGLIVVTAGCYHATITTGRQPSGQTIEQAWAHGFVYGLVPPSTVETASQCPNGVAQVETQHSFLNMLAQFLTFGIYTPMTITVQCAAAAPAPDDASVVRLPESASIIELAKALNDAAARSVAEGTTVLVDFGRLDH